MEIDQLSFDNSSSFSLSRSTILVIHNSQLETKNVGIEMYSSLMGNFHISTLILVIISTPSGGS